MSVQTSGTEITGSFPSKKKSWIKKLSFSSPFAKNKRLPTEMQSKSLTDECSAIIPEVQHNKLNEHQASSNEDESGSGDQIEVKENENTPDGHSEDVDNSIDEFACSASLKNDQTFEKPSDTISSNNRDTRYSSLINESFIGSVDSLKSFCVSTADKLNEGHTDICSYITEKIPDNKGILPHPEKREVAENRSLGSANFIPSPVETPEKEKAIISDVKATKEYVELLLHLERPIRPYQLEQKASQLELSREAENPRTQAAIKSLRCIARHAGGGGPKAVRAAMENYIDR